MGHVDVITFVDDVQSTRVGCKILYSQSIPQPANTSRAKLIWQMLTPFQPYALFPEDKQCAGIVKSFIDKGTYDIIVCRYIPDAMKCGLLEFADRLVVDVDDNPYDLERSAILSARTTRKKLYHLYRSAIVRNVVKQIQRRCRFTFYSNPAQAVYPNSAFLPNIPYYDYEMQLADFSMTGHRLLFVGNMSYAPNTRGINHFIDQVFPQVRKQIPDVELHLVGGCNQPDYIEKWNQTDGVKYMGFVDDLKQEYAESRVVVVPMYEGAGTNIKVLEAMKMKRPCVTTQYGYRGFADSFHSGVELLVSKDDNDFVSYVVEALSDEELNHTLSERAYAAVTKEYSRQAFNSIVAKSIIR